MLQKQYLISAAAGALVLAGIGAGAMTFAATGSGVTSSSPHAMHPQGVAGTVTAVNGNSITLTGKDGTTFTVDASSAAITKDETATVADMKVGDTLSAQGTVTGTSVAATTIHDGKFPVMGFWGNRERGGGPHLMRNPTGTTATSTQ